MLSFNLALMDAEWTVAPFGEKVANERAIGHSLSHLTRVMGGKGLGADCDGLWAIPECIPGFLDNHCAANKKKIYELMQQYKEI